MLKDKEKISIADAVNIIKNDGVIVHPTDTVTGISGSYRSQKAYDEIYRLKQRSFTKPLGILLSSFTEISLFTSVPIKEFEAIIPLLEEGTTLIVKRKETLPAHLLKQSECIGFRIPKHQPLKELIKKTGPLICTSANISGEEPVKTLEECNHSFGEDIPFLEGDSHCGEKPSSILLFDEGKYTLVREGKIPASSIKKYIPLSKTL